MNTDATALAPTVFESFFNQYVHPAVLLDTDAPRHTVLAVSDAFLEATQQTREELVGKGFFEFFENESRGRELGRLRTATEALLATGRPFTTSAYQFNFERPDGSRAIRYWNLDTRLMTLDGGGGLPKQIIAHTACDVTDQVLVQQMQTHLLEHSEMDKMRMAEERSTLQRLVDSKRVGAFTISPVMDANGEIVDFRFRTMTTMMRTQMEKMIGREDIEYISEAVFWYPRGDAPERYRDVMLTGKTSQFDYNCMTEKGERWFQITITRLSPEELLITIIDQTEIKQIQVRLEQTIEALRRTNANLEDFAYAASHDLQEPLRKIQTFSAMLHARCENTLDAQAIALLARMQSATARMRTLIEDLLQYSRLSLGEEVFDEVCLKSMVQELLWEYADELNACRATVEVQGLENVCGLPAQLQSLFKQLLDNALKFSHKERPLVLKITGCRTATTEAAQPADHGLPLRFLRIDFEDNGIGFDPEYEVRVFQLFQRLHGRSETSGTGVGLAMVQKIAANHKGVVGAAGRPGEGATFTVWLPLPDAANADCL